MYTANDLIQTKYNAYLRFSQTRLERSLKILSSGDALQMGERPGELAISISLEAKIRIQQEGDRNLVNTLLMVQTTDAYMGVVQDILNRMSELTIGSLDATLTNADRKTLDLEFSQLRDEIQRMSEKASYNGVTILSGVADEVLSSSSSEDSGGIESDGIRIFEHTIGERIVPVVSSIGGPPTFSYTHSGTPITTVSGSVPITYSFVSSLIASGALTGINSEEIQDAIERALATWSQAVPFTFTEVPDTGPDPFTTGDTDYPNMDITTYPIMRFGKQAIDGLNNVLAHAFSPEGIAGLYSDVHYDIAETWNIGKFLEVTLHEVGHALGLGHISGGEDAIMEPIFAGRFDALEDIYLLPSDVAGIQDFYVAGTNTGPVIRLEGNNNLNYIAGGGAALLADQAFVYDNTSSNFDDGTMTIQLISGGNANDVFSITAGGDVGVSGSNILYNAVTVGTFTGGTAGTPLEITFNGYAESTGVSAILQRISYTNATVTAGSASKTVMVQMTDGDGAISQPAIISVNFPSSGSFPVMDIGNTSIKYETNESARILASSANLSYATAPNFDFGTLTVQFNSGGAAGDLLAVRNQSGGEGSIFLQAPNIIGRVVNSIGIAVGTYTGGSAGASLVITLQPNLTTDDVESLIENITYRNSSGAPSTADRNLAFVLSDGTGQVATGNVTVKYDNNEDPVLSFQPTISTFTEGAGSIFIDSAATVTDADSGDFSGGSLVVTFTTGATDGEDTLSIENQGLIAVSAGSISYSGTIIGSYTGGSGPSDPLTVTFGSNATPTRVTALLEAITYSNSVVNPENSNRIVSFTISDGDGGSTQQYKTIRVENSNSAPVVTISNTPLSYTEGDGAVVIDSSTSVTDSDSSDFSGGSMTVQFTAGGTAPDVLSVKNVGTGAGQISVSGSNISYQGVLIGTVSGGTDGSTPLQFSFNGSSTTAAVSALLKNITYANASDNPSTTPRTLRFVINDGDGASSIAVTKTINVTASNDGPQISFDPTTLDYYEGDGPVIIDSTISVSDIDSANFNAGQVVLSVTTGATADDSMSIQNQGTGAGQISVSGSNVSYQGTLIGTFSGGSDGSTPLVVTLNTNANDASTSALLAALRYENVTASLTGTTSRTLTFRIDDGDGAYLEITKDINVHGINNDPNLTFPGEPLIYTVGGGPIFLDPTAIVSDADSPDFNTGTLTATISIAGSVDDRLTLENQGLVTILGNTVLYSGVQVGTFLGGSGTTSLVITFDADASVAAVQNVVRSLTYDNVSSTPSTATRTVSVFLEDGDGGTSLSRTQTITFLNRGPTITLSPSDISYLEGDGRVVLDASAVVTDPDSDDFSGGILTFSFEEGGEASDSLSIQNQGTGAGQIGISGNAISYGGTQIGTFSGTAPLVILLNSSATATAVSSLLKEVTFENSSENPGTTTRKINISMTDGDGGSSVATYKNINVTGINDAPIVLFPGISASYEAGGVAQVLDASATVSDVDSANFNGGVLTISIASGGSTTDRISIRNVGSGSGEIGFSATKVRYGGIIIGTASGGAGTPLSISLNASATVEAVQALMREITFANVATSPDTTDRIIQMVLVDGDGTANGGDDTSDAALLTLSVTIPTSASTDESTGTSRFAIDVNGVISNLSLGDLRSDTLGITGISITSAMEAKEALTALQIAVEAISEQRTTLQSEAAAIQAFMNGNRQQNIDLGAAASRMRDADVSTAVTEMKNSIIQAQTANGVLKAAFQLIRGVEALLR